MSTRTRETRSHLFTLRVWPEDVEDGSTEWRGRIQHTASSETVYFRDWESMLAFLKNTLDTTATGDGREEEKLDERASQHYNVTKATGQ